MPRLPYNIYLIVICQSLRWNRVTSMPDPSPDPGALTGPDPGPHRGLTPPPRGARWLAAAPAPGAHCESRVSPEGGGPGATGSLTL